MSNMTPKEVEETCPSCETWGVLGSWLKVTECQIAFIMNLNAKKRLHFVFSVLQKAANLTISLQSLLRVPERVLSGADYSSTLATVIVGSISNRASETQRVTYDHSSTLIGYY